MKRPIIEFSISSLNYSTKYSLFRMKENIFNFNLNFLLRSFYKNLGLCATFKFYHNYFFLKINPKFFSSKTEIQVLLNINLIIPMHD